MSPRDVEVLRLLARGRSNAEIARKLVFSEADRQDPREQCPREAPAAGPIQAVIVAYERGLVPG